MDTRTQGPVALRSPRLAAFAVATVWTGLGLWVFAAAVPAALATAGFGVGVSTVVVAGCTTADRGDTVEIRCATTDHRVVVGVPRPHRPGDRIVVATLDGTLHARSSGRLGMNLVGMVALLLAALLPTADLVRSSAAARRGARVWRAGPAASEALGRTVATLVATALVGIVVVTAMSLLD